jgi:hypothetical protein
MRTLVVLPTYNETGNIERMLETLRDTVSACDILVVDDGSPTAPPTRPTPSPFVGDRFRFCDARQEAVLGSAYRAGFAWGLERGYEAFVEIDCDFSHDPAALPEMLHLAQENDLVIGSRYVPGGAIPSWKSASAPAVEGGNRYASIMLGLGVADATAGYRVYRGSLLEKMRYETVSADGYGFQVEMTYRARLAGATICETPISFVDRSEGESKMSGNIIVEALWLVTKWGVARRFRRPTF